MKKILSILAITLTSSAAMANNGTMSFTGTVSPGGTCPIDVVTPGTGVPMPVLNLGNYKTQDFVGAGQETPRIGFALRLTPGGSCTIGTGKVANVTFTPAYGQAGTSGDLYGLQDGIGYTKGLGLKISDRTGAQLAPDTPSMDYPLSQTDPTEMVFSARLQQIAPAVEQGDIASTVTFVVAIN
ncbi:fimbrial protein [Pseudomonas plecoglossicida]|jgi:major type 1 subunit fimbrin (pilin)|nr:MULTISPECIES: fimbrial protein [Pseudomonas]EKT4505793.1 type 1 fimbrial protein [Pseudomonas putida]ELS0926251.1 type 1 fimbrial protein [Pseudomonas putida]MCE0906729.1 type 1 fimbrial protein [Pseudomonas alloputida]MCE1055703.1 type 1 fimbrial protein [Pseudomonas alloputida]MCE1060774.1 type 1 fimbrial protein [Pseudomonas alloputida]